MIDNIHPDGINALVFGDHGAPFDILGIHQLDAGQIVVRAFRPTATTLTLIDLISDKRHEMSRVHESGLFRVAVPGKVSNFRYRLEEQNDRGDVFFFYDPYAFPPMLSDYDIYLFGQGRHLNIYDKMGAHLRSIGNVDGVNFAVWAPNARRVSVIGQFNNWDGRTHQMRKHPSGIWELFVPGLSTGELYRYEIKSLNLGYMAEKIDPYGFQFEMRPNTASIVADINSYEWHDESWMMARAETNHLEAPISIYEMHAGSWKRKPDGTWYNYRELAHELVPYVKKLNYTHIEMMPLAEHPLDASWGYQVTGYYAPTSRFGSPEDLMYFVDYCHSHGIGIILDWVPAHFPKDGHALSFFDGTHLYSHEDPRKGEHPDWGTLIFNYGRNEVRNFLTANALFWLRKYHIDGLRVDAVSSMVYLDFSRKEGEWIPNQYGGNENLDAVSFLKETNEVIHREAPGAITIAEESTAWPMVSRPTYIGGLGFTFKWNMGWMHDTLSYIRQDSIYRRYAHNQLTFSMMYAYTENFVLSLSHDEVVHGKGSLMGKVPGDWWQKFATLRLLYGYQYTHPGKKLNFMGQEIAQWTEWSEARQLDWQIMELPTHQRFSQWVADVNALYQEEGALFEQDYNPAGFQWIDANDADQSVFTYIRYAKDKEDFLTIACNFTPVPRYNYRIGVPTAGFYEEVLNSDSEYYGGSNIGNNGGIQTEDIAWNWHKQSLSLTIPPLGIVILKRKS